MAKDVKIELIYYQTNTDFSLEFGLHGNYPLRILSNSCDDMRSFFQCLKRAVSRSEIIITIGGYLGSDYIPKLIGNSIRKQISVPDYKSLGIIAEKPFPIPDGAFPLSSDRKVFGGFLIECGPQAIISLSDDKKVRLNIVETTVAPYIAEHYAVYGNRYIAPASQTPDAEPEVKNETAVKSSDAFSDSGAVDKTVIAPVTASNENLQVNNLCISESDSTDSKKNNGLNSDAEVVIPVTHETAGTEEAASVLFPEANGIASGKETIPDNDIEISVDFDASDLKLNIDSDNGDNDESDDFYEEPVNAHYNWLRILTTALIVSVLLIFAGLYAYFGIYKSSDSDSTGSLKTESSSSVDFTSKSDNTIPTVVIGNDEVFFNDTRSENEEFFEQTPIPGEETDFPLPVPVPIPNTSSSESDTSKDGSSQTVSSEKAVSSKNESQTDNTSGNPSTTSEATESSVSSDITSVSSGESTASVTSTESSTESKTESGTSFVSSTEETSSTDTSSETESESTSSVTSETESKPQDPEPQQSSDPILSWDISITVYNSKTSTYVTGTATEIVEMITEAEIGSSSPPEALKAQAAAAYSWLITNGAASGKKPTVPLNSNVGQRTKDAVAAVKGTVISYNGYFAETYYSAYSAGYTASYQDVWQDGKHFPYLQSVECLVDEKLKNFETVKVYTAEEIKMLIKSKLGVDVSEMPKNEWIVPVKYDSNDLYCVTVRIGGIEKTGSYFRSTFLSYGVRSTAFKVAYSEKDDTFTFTSRGWGHGVGMSQDGACAYAKDYGWNYIQILEHFYPGVTISKYI